MENDPLPELPGIVRSLRRGLGWSQQKFAQTIGVDQTTISQYETGRAVPSVEVLLKMNLLSDESGIPRDIINRQISRRFGSFTDEDWDTHLRRIADDVPIHLTPSWSVFRDPQEEFMAEVKAFVTETNPLTFRVIPDVVRILRLYREHSSDTRAPSVFQKAADYIEVELHKQVEQAEKKRRVRAKTVSSRKRTAKKR